MHPRSQAIQILQQARDTLAERLTERIVDSQREILEDAEGSSYLSEIETIYDQLGSRLAHVNTMLSNLPVVEEARPVEVPLGEPIFTDVTSGFGAEFHSAAPPLLSPLALPAPETTAERVPALAAPTNFALFVQQLQLGDLAGAGSTLAVLFNLDEARALRCAQTFGERLHSRPETLLDAMRLRGEVQGGSVNGALVLLAECFGLQGIESLAALQALQSRFPASAE